MSALHENDLALIANKRVLRNASITLDHALERTITDAVQQLDDAASICPALNTWLARGLEHPIEFVANGALPVPRLLYATTNPSFSPSPGADDLQTLVNHMNEFDVVATGPVVALLPKQFECGPVTIDNPCPIAFRTDPSRRFTFLRNGFFQNDAPDFLEVVSDGVLITVQGQAYRGDLFSRSLAQHTPNYTFVMKLRYDIAFVKSDVGLGPVPFVMTADPPAPSVAGAPSLPKKDSFIFGFPVADNPPILQGAVLPALIPFDGTVDGKGCDAQEGCQPGDILGNLFTGALDDVMYETIPADPATAVPRYRVESRSDDEPQRLVIRQIGDPNATVLAEAKGGRLEMTFVKIESLDLTPLGQASPVTAADKQNIDKSLVKFQPTLFRVVSCANGLTGALENLKELILLGKRGLDFPILPQNTAVPASAHVVTSADTQAIQDGHPVNSVISGVSDCDLTAKQFFPDTQSFGMSGIVGGNGKSFDDFSSGSDLSIGTGQQFLQPHIDAMAEGMKDEIKSQSLPGLDDNSVTFHANILDDKIAVEVTGEGEIETPFFMPNIPYAFTVDLSIHLRAQMKVALKKDKLVDRFGCPIPETLLTTLGLDIAGNQLELPTAASPQGIPEENPIGFYAYFDPGDGIACFSQPNAPCPQQFRVPPPVIDAEGNEIVIDDPTNPPNICEDPATKAKEQQPDNTRLYGQVSWDLSDNEHLKHVWALTTVPPTEDDVDVDVDVNFLALFFVSLLGASVGPLLIAALGTLGPLGAMLTPVVIMVGLSALILLPLSGVIAGSIATDIVARELAKRHGQFGEMAPNAFVGVFLDPNAPFALQSGAFGGALIVRAHLLFQTAGISKFIPS